MVFRSVACDASGINSGTYADRAGVIRNLCDVIGDRTERPLSDGLGGGEVDVEDVACRIVILGVGRIDFVVDRGQQVPTVPQIRKDQFRLEGPPGIADTAESGWTRLG